MPLTATIAPASSAARRPRRVAAGVERTRGPHAGQAFGWAWKRRSRGSSYSAWQAAHIVKPAIVVERAVVRDAGDDREPRAAVGAVDERVAVAAVGRVEELGQAGVAGRGVGRDRRVRARRRAGSRGSRSRRSPASGIASRAHALDRAPAAAPRPAGARGTRRPRRPRPRRSTPRASLKTKPAAPSSRRQPVHERPEPDALHRRPDTRARTLTAELHQRVVRARLRLLDARDVLGAHDDHVVGQRLGGDPPAVVADERDRRQPAPARLGQRRDHVRRRARRRQREQRVARRGRARSPGGRRSPRRRCRWRSRSGSRVVGEVQRAPPARAQVGDDVHRVGRRAAVAQREHAAGRAARRRPRSARRAFSASVCSRSAPISAALASIERRTSSRTASRSGARRRRGTDRGSDAAPAPDRATARGARGTRARAPRARGRASRSAPGG